MLNKTNKNKINKLLNLIDKNINEIYTIINDSFDKFPNICSDPLTIIITKTDFIRTELDNLTELPSKEYDLSKIITYKTINNRL